MPTPRHQAFDSFSFASNMSVKAAHQTKIYRKTKIIDGMPSTEAQYVYIPMVDINGDTEHQFVPEYAAMGADLGRLLAPAIYPKVRVVTRATPDGSRLNAGMVSRLVDDFADFNQINSYTADFPRLLQNLNKKQVAAILINSFFCAENDLRNGNWGRDKHGNVIRIDFDMTFFDYTCWYKDDEKDRHEDIRSLTNWPQMIYNRQVAFPITCDDIDNFPIIHDAKPANWPNQGVGFNTNHDWNKYFLRLQQDPEFKKLKWLYFTKIICLSDTQLIEIVQDHTHRPEQSAAMIDYLTQRREDLKKQLLSSREYQEYINKFSTEQLAELMLELAESNKIYQNKATGELKPKFYGRDFTIEHANKVIAELKEYCSHPNIKLITLQNQIENLTKLIAREQVVIGNIQATIGKYYPDGNPSLLFKNLLIRHINNETRYQNQLQKTKGMLSTFGLPASLITEPRPASPADAVMIPAERSQSVTSRFDHAPQIGTRDDAYTTLWAPGFAVAPRASVVSDIDMVARAQGQPAESYDDAPAVYWGSPQSSVMPGLSPSLLRAAAARPAAMASSPLFSYQLPGLQPLPTYPAQVAQPAYPTAVAVPGLATDSTNSLLDPFESSDIPLGGYRLDR